MTRRTSAEFTEDELSILQTFTVKMLLAVAAGRLDLNDLACQELVSRGLDRKGRWVGFAKARAIYERSRAGSTGAAEGGRS